MITEFESQFNDAFKSIIPFLAAQSVFDCVDNGFDFDSACIFATRTIQRKVTFNPNLSIIFIISHHSQFYGKFFDSLQSISTYNQPIGNIRFLLLVSLRLHWDLVLNILLSIKISVSFQSPFVLRFTKLWRWLSVDWRGIPELKFLHNNKSKEVWTAPSLHLHNDLIRKILR